MQNLHEGDFCSIKYTVSKLDSSTSNAQMRLWDSKPLLVILRQSMYYKIWNAMPLRALKVQAKRNDVLNKTKYYMYINWFKTRKMLII